MILRTAPGSGGSLTNFMGDVFIMIGVMITLIAVFLLIKVWWWDKSDIPFLKQKVLAKCQQFKVSLSNVVIDEGGIGGGLVDDPELFGVQGFVDASSSIKEPSEEYQDTKKYNYKNLRAQCFFTLADFVNKNKIGLTGHSLGGMTVVLYAATRDIRIKSLIVQSAVSEIEKTEPIQFFKTKEAIERRYAIFDKDWDSVRINYSFYGDSTLIHPFFCLFCDIHLIVHLEIKIKFRIHYFKYLLTLDS